MKKIYIFLYLLFTFNLYAAKSSRLIQFSWDKIEGATTYELKLFNIKNDVKKELEIYKLKTTTWSDELPPGKYLYQIRTLDYRNVPGEWGEEGGFNIGHPDLKIISPIKNQSLFLEDSGRSNITFKWKATSKEEKYRFILTNKKNKIIEDQNLDTNQIEVSLNKKGKYYWKVFIDDGNDDKAQKKDFLKEIKKHSFTVFPPRIPAPTMELILKNKYLYLTWLSSPITKKHKIEFYRKYKKKWKKVYKKVKKKKRIRLKSRKFKRGFYKIQIISYAKKLKSAPGTLYFNWNNKKLSNVSSDQPVQKQHIEYLKDKGGRTPFLIEGGFSLLSKKYSGNVISTETEISDNISGNRFYINTIFNIKKKKKIKNNIEALLSYENIVTSKNKWTFINAGATYNFLYNKKKQIRSFGAGLFYKDDPYVYGDGVTNKSDRLKSSNIGILLQAKYAYLFTEKLDLGVKVKFYYSLLGIKSPDGLEQEMTPTFIYGPRLRYALKTDLYIGAYYNLVKEGVNYDTEKVKITGSEVAFFTIIDI